MLPRNMYLVQSSPMQVHDYYRQLHRKLRKGRLLPPIVSYPTAFSSNGEDQQHQGNNNGGNFSLQRMMMSPPPPPPPMSSGSTGATCNQMCVCHTTRIKTAQEAAAGKISKQSITMVKMFQFKDIEAMNIGILLYRSFSHHSRRLCPDTPAAQEASTGSTRAAAQSHTAQE